MKTRILLFSLALLLLPAVASAKLDPETEGQIYTVLERANRSGDHHTRALATEFFGSLRPETTRAYALDALKDPVFEVRAAAVVALIALKDSSYAELITMEMTNPKRDMARDIMPLLARLGDKEAVGLALKVMAQPKATTKNAIIAAFGALGGPRAAAFFKALMTGKDHALAEAVQGYLLTLRTQAVLPLFAIIAKKGTPAMQARMLDALAEFPKGTDLGFVRKAYAKSKNPVLAQAAARLLAKHGDRAAVPMLLPQVNISNEKRTIAALEALVNVAGKDMFGALAPFLRRKDVNPKILELVFEIHVRAGDTSILDTVRRYRRNDNIRVQAVCVYYLGILEKGRALATLHEDLFHGDASVRLAAVKAVGKIGSRESVAPLGRLLDATREATLKTEVVKALAGISDRSIVPIVSFLITDPVPSVRKWAIIALARVHHKDAVSSLKIALNDADLETRSEAVLAIMKLDPMEGVTAFRRALGWIFPGKLESMAQEMGADFLPYADMALTSSRPEIQAVGLAVLKRYPKHEVGLLQAALKRTRDDGLKAAILRRLVARNGAKELTRIAGVIDTGTPALKRVALELLGTLGAPEADAILKKMLFDADEANRVTAAVALLKMHNAKPKRHRRARRGRKKRGHK